MTDSELVLAAWQAQAFAHAPYSKFQVGAALLAKNGKLYTGSNVESSSYGLSICAERVALFKALSEGEENFSKIAVVAESKFVVPPCGACRQLLFDYAREVEILLSNEKGKFEKMNLSDLLPHPFGKEML